MISRLNKILLCLLVLLQFIAPLVHAHSDNAMALAGLHLPEMESVFIHHRQPILQEGSHQCNNHVIISIGMGIKNKKTDCNNGSKDCLVSTETILLAKINTRVNFSPHTEIFKPPSFFKSQSPRAPPIMK